MSCDLGAVCWCSRWGRMTSRRCLRRWLRTSSSTFTPSSPCRPASWWPRSARCSSTCCWRAMQCETRTPRWRCCTVRWRDCWRDWVWRGETLSSCCATGTVTSWSSALSTTRGSTALTGPTRRSLGTGTSLYSVSCYGLVVWCILRVVVDEYPNLTECLWSHSSLRFWQQQKFLSHNENRICAWFLIFYFCAMTVFYNDCLNKWKFVHWFIVTVNASDSWCKWQ